MTPFQRILCAVDGKPMSDLVIREAVALAARSGAALCFVHATSEPYAVANGFSASSLESDPESPDFPETILGRIAAQVERVTSRPAAAQDIRIRAGIEAVVIAAFAEDTAADLVVVGSLAAEVSGENPALAALLVARHTPCSTLVVRPGPSRGPVLVVCTRPEPDSLAIDVGATIAKGLQADLTVIHIQRPGGAIQSSGLEPSLPSASQGAAQRRREAEERLRAAMAAVGAAGIAVVAEGDAPSGTIIAARNLGARLLVVDSTDRLSKSQGVLERTAEQSVREAPCSTLLIRRAVGASGRPRP